MFLWEASALWSYKLYLKLLLPESFINSHTEYHAHTKSDEEEPRTLSEKNSRRTCIVAIKI